VNKIPVSHDALPYYANHSANLSIDSLVRSCESGKSITGLVRSPFAASRVNSTLT
jgi:hypothetical protein